MARTSEHRVTLYSLLLKTASNPKQRFCTATKIPPGPAIVCCVLRRRPAPCQKNYSQAPLSAHDIPRTSSSLEPVQPCPTCCTRSRYLPTESPERSVLHCSYQTLALRFFLATFSLGLLRLRLRERRHVRLPIGRR